MDSIFVRHWWLLACRGAIAIIFGVLALMWPGITLLSLAALFAAFTLVGGAVSVFAAVRNRQQDERWWTVLLLGLTGVAAGAVAVLYPTLTMVVLVLLVGAHALVSGVFEIAAAIRLRKQIEGEWMLALAGVASVLFGLVVLLYPTGMGAVALASLLGLYAIATGIVLVALSLRVRSWLARKPPRPGQDGASGTAEGGGGADRPAPAAPRTHS
jgi:uncharacterized membrane protein HdeD (DUF308 family)